MAVKALIAYRAQLRWVHVGTSQFLIFVFYCFVLFLTPKWKETDGDLNEGGLNAGGLHEGGLNAGGQISLSYHKEVVKLTH